MRQILDFLWPENGEPYHTHLIVTLGYQTDICLLAIYLRAMVIADIYYEFVSLLELREQLLVWLSGVCYSGLG